MTRVAFDTLAYAKRLEAAGVAPKIAETQAEAQADLLAGLMDDKLATKQDIKDLRSEFRSELNIIHTELKTLESKLTIKLGGIMVMGIGVMSTLITILHIGFR